jgi:antitoxin (DNA-binding transcriptional repressor) of toxin-antitoxin stability system
MKEISAVEFRRDMEAFIRKVQQGKSFLMTYRGEPAVRLEPVVPTRDDRQSGADTLLSFCELGERLVPPGPQTELTNAEIDRLIYGG